MNVSSSNRTIASSSGRIRQFMQHHPLVCYFLMAYGFSWLAWVPYILSQSGLGILPMRMSQFGILPGAYLGPLLSGFLMTAATKGKPGVGRLLRRLALRQVGWQWYLFILVGLPAILFLSYLILPGAVLVLQIPSIPQLTWLFPLFLLLEIFTSGLAEEPGWRGFALPRLQQRYGPLPGTVILGLLWGGWHLPLFLTAWTNGSNGLAIGEFIFIALGTAVMITWVFNHTRGSLLVAILFHATVDAFSSAVIEANLFQTQWMLKYESVAQLIGFGVVVPLLLIIATRGRLGYKRAFSTSDTIPLNEF